MATGKVKYHCIDCPEYEVWDDVDNGETGWCKWGKGVVHGEKEHCGHLYRWMKGEDKTSDEIEKDIGKRYGWEK